jgi:hypothetical protein
MAAGSSCFRVTVRKGTARGQRNLLCNTTIPTGIASLPIRLLYLFGGVCMGLGLGILPGMGGVAGTALLLPFTFNMDAPAAFAPCWA